MAGELVTYYIHSFNEDHLLVSKTPGTELSFQEIYVKHEQTNSFITVIIRGAFDKFPDFFRMGI